MDIKNIIHVGGHFGQEVALYKEINPYGWVDIFEPHPETYGILCKNTAIYSGIRCHNIALGPSTDRKQMFTETANAGQSNSLLRPKHHTVQYPSIIFNSMVTVQVEQLDIFEFDETYTFMSLDVQGFELEVLKGATKTLDNIKYIISEVNNKELYEGCCMVEELDEFLNDFKFRRIDTIWEGGTWGDGLYIKE